MPRRRRSSRRRRLAGPLTVVLAATLGLSACGGDEDDDGSRDAEIASVEVGDCLDADDGNDAETDDEVFATDHVVDCDDAHQFEVVAVVDLPDELRDDETTTLDHRDDLVSSWDRDDDGELSQVNDWARATCFDELAAAAGLDAIEIDGESVGDGLTIVPGTSGVTSKAVYPVESWQEWPRVVCTARFGELADEVDPDSTDPTDTVDIEGGFLIGDFLTTDFPEEFRQCGNTDDDVDVPGECEDPHYREFLFLIDVTDLIGDDVMDDILAAEKSDSDEIWPSDESWEVLDDFCTAGMEVVIGEDYDRRSLSPFPSMEGDWHGDSPRHWVLCSTRPVQSALHDLPGGSVIGIGDEEVERVPYEG